MELPTNGCLGSRYPTHSSKSRRMDGARSFCGTADERLFRFEVSTHSSKSRRMDGARSLCGTADERLFRFEVSHPSDKNKDVARVGHPDFVELPMKGAVEVRGIPPIRQKADEWMGHGALVELMSVQWWSLGGTHIRSMVEPWWNSCPFNGGALVELMPVQWWSFGGTHACSTEASMRAS